MTSKSFAAAVLFAVIVAVPAVRALAGEEDSNEKIAASIKTITNKDAQSMDKERAVRYLATPDIAPLAAGALMDELEKNEDAYARLSIMLCMNSFTDANMFEPGLRKLLALFDNSNYGVRFWAVRLSGRIKSKAALEPLQKQLADKDAVIRREAAAALGKQDDTSSADALVALLKDPSDSVRCAAAEALGAMSAGSAKKNLIDILASDSSVPLQKACVDALEKITAVSFNIEKIDWFSLPEARNQKIEDWIDKNK